MSGFNNSASTVDPLSFPLPTTNTSHDDDLLSSDPSISTASSASQSNNSVSSINSISSTGANLSNRSYAKVVTEGKHPGDHSKTTCGEDETIAHQPNPSPLEEAKELFERVIGEKVVAVGDVVNQQENRKRNRKTKREGRSINESTEGSYKRAKLNNSNINNSSTSNNHSSNSNGDSDMEIVQNNSHNNSKREKQENQENFEKQSVDCKQTVKNKPGIQI